MCRKLFESETPLRELPLIRTIQAPDYAVILDQHIDHYSRVEKFDRSFHPIVESALENFRTSTLHTVNQAFVLDINDTFGGSIFCVHQNNGTARLKLFYLIPQLRKQGYGKMLLNHAIEHIANHGYRQIIVSTYTIHADACELYRRMGFVQIDEKPVSAYGQELIEVSLRLVLNPSVS